MRIIIPLLSPDRSVADNLVLLARQIPAINHEQFSQQKWPIYIAKSKTALDGHIAHRVAEAAALTSRRIASGFLIGILMTHAAPERHAEYHSARRSAGGRALRSEERRVGKECRSR